MLENKEHMQKNKTFKAIKTISVIKLFLQHKPLTRVHSVTYGKLLRYCTSTSVTGKGPETFALCSIIIGPITLITDTYQRKSHTLCPLYSSSRH